MPLLLLLLALIGISFIDLELVDLWRLRNLIVFSALYVISVLIYIEDVYYSLYQLVDDELFWILVGLFVGPIDILGFLSFILIILWNIFILLILLSIFTFLKKKR